MLAFGALPSPFRTRSAVRGERPAAPSSPSPSSLIRYSSVAVGWRRQRLTAVHGAKAQPAQPWTVLCGVARAARVVPSDSRNPAPATGLKRYSYAHLIQVAIHTRRCAKPFRLITENDRRSPAAVPNQGTLLCFTPLITCP